jgi:hypothetical protein
LLTHKTSRRRSSPPKGRKEIAAGGFISHLSYFKSSKIRPIRLDAFIGRFKMVVDKYDNYAKVAIFIHNHFESPNIMFLSDISSFLNLQLVAKKKREMKHFPNVNWVLFICSFLREIG